MGVFVADDPLGIPRKFNIEGDAPTAAERKWITGHLADLYGAPAAAEAPKAAERPSWGRLALEGAKRSGETAIQAPETIRALTGDVAARERVAGREDTGPRPMDLGEITGPRDFLSFMGGNVADMFGRAGAPALVGAGLGALVGGPAGAALGAGIGGTFGAGALEGLSTSEESLQRQKQEGIAPEDMSGAKAALAGGVTGALSAGSGAIMARAAGLLGKKAATEAATQAIAGQTAKGAALRGAAKGAAESAAVEGAQEGSTEALLRYSANQDLTSPEGMRDIGKAGLAGAILGGTLGGVGGGVGGMRERTLAQVEVARLTAERDKAQADIEAATTETERAVAEERKRSAEVALGKIGDWPTPIEPIGPSDRNPSTTVPEWPNPIDEPVPPEAATRIGGVPPTLPTVGPVQPPPPTGPDFFSNRPLPGVSVPEPPVGENRLRSQVEAQMPNEPGIDLAARARAAEAEQARRAAFEADMRQQTGLGPNIAPPMAAPAAAPPVTPLQTEGFAPGTPTATMQARAGAVAPAPNVTFQNGFDGMANPNPLAVASQPPVPAQPTVAAQPAAAPPAPPVKAPTVAERKAAKAAAAAPVAAAPAVPAAPAAPAVPKKAMTAAERKAAKAAPAAPAAPAVAPVKPGTVVKGVRMDPDEAAVMRATFGNNPVYKAIVSNIARIENAVRSGELTPERGVELLSDRHNATPSSAVRELYSDAIARLPKKAPREPVAGPPAPPKAAAAPRNPPNGPLNPAKAAWFQEIFEAAKGLWNRDANLRARMSEEDFLRGINSLGETLPVGYDPRAVVQMATDPQLVANARRAVAENEVKDQSTKLFSKLQEAAAKKKNKT